MEELERVEMKWIFCRRVKSEAASRSRAKEGKKEGRMERWKDRGIDRSEKSPIYSFVATCVRNKFLSCLALEAVSSTLPFSLSPFNFKVLP